MCRRPRARGLSRSRPNRRVRSGSARNAVTLTAARRVAAAVEAGAEAEAEAEAEAGAGEAT